MCSFSHDSDTDAIECRIRTLTTILQSIQPRSHRLDGPDFSHTPGLLDYLVNLLHWDDDDGYGTDGDFGNMLAMTGVQTPDGLRMMAVALNRPADNDKVQVVRVVKSNKTFDELVNRQSTSSITDQFSDVWTALSHFEDGLYSEDQISQRFQALSRFIVARNFRRIASLLKEISSSSLDLSGILLDWNPQSYDLQESRWLKVPSWLASVDRRNWPSQDIEQHTDAEPTSGKRRFEFSSVTAKAWVALLGSILAQLVSEVQRHEVFLEPQSNDRSALDNIAAWTSLLSSYLNWDECIVQTLLCDTSLSTHVFEGTNSVYGNALPFSGARVITHLKKITAWYDALENLFLNEEYSSIRNSSESHATCLIQIPVHSGITFNCSSRENLKTHFIEYCTPSSETLLLLDDVLDENYPTDFYGSFHAEAVLMGLVNQFSLGTPFSNLNGVQFKPETRALLKEFIVPLPKKKLIVLSDASPPCSCCRWLGTRLNCDFQLRPTKGQFTSTSPWTAPPVGVGKSILEELEANLLDELDFRLRIIKISTAHEEQPETDNEDGYAATMSDYSSPEDRDFEVSD